MAGGIGGARMARGLAAVLEPAALTVIVNVGDDEEIYGAHVSADVDTVMYTLAGIEGPHGWGIAGDTFDLMDRLGSLGVDTTFRLGDRDYAYCLFRTLQLQAGRPLSAAVAAVCSQLGIECSVLPATDDAVRTRVRTTEDEWLDFQEYFVLRRHAPDIAEVQYRGVANARPSPGAVEAIQRAELVVVAPSNPPLSIWPILEVPGMKDALDRKARVVGVSPLIGGKAVKGPAKRVMAGLGLPAGTAGVLAAYDGLLTDLFVHRGDEVDEASARGVSIHAADIVIRDPAPAARLAARIVDLA